MTYQIAGAGASGRMGQMLIQAIDDTADCSLAGALDMGVDMPTGTGWPFGGPQVTDEDARDKLVTEVVKVAGGAVYTLVSDRSKLEALVAVPSLGASLSLLNLVDAQGRRSGSPQLDRSRRDGLDRLSAGYAMVRHERKARRAGRQGQMHQPFLQAIAHSLPFCI